VSTGAVTIRPPRIKRGETLGIVAPAGPIKVEKFKAGLARLGDAFRLRVADSVTAPHPPDVPSYLSAADDVRVAELDAMLNDRDVRAILCARGGYGLTRILPRLDAEALRRDPKPIIGFSDATALLAWAHAAGVRGIHGPMVVQMSLLPDADIAYLIELVSDARAPGVRPWRLAGHGKGRYRGPIIPANLTMFSLLVGTPWQLPVRGAITLIEEVGEKPYELDRYMTHLALTGELAVCEPKTLRYRLLHTAGRLTFHARRATPQGRPRRSVRRSVTAIATRRSRSAPTRSSISTPARSRSPSPP
jgi:muramoyltetrapeptide carboxypeptidase